MRCSKSGKGWVSRVSQAGPTGPTYLQTSPFHPCRESFCQFRIFGWLGSEKSPQFMGVGSVGSTLCFNSESYRRNTIETTISRPIWLDSDGTVESTLRFRSKIQVRDPKWRSVSTILIGIWIWILDPRSELIQGTRRQNGTGVSKCVESVFCASKNRKYKNAQNEILDVRF